LLTIRPVPQPEPENPVNTETLTAAARLQALNAAIHALAAPLAAGGADPLTVAATGQQVQALADLADEIAERLLIDL
jgi:hypothetical protein